MKITLSQKLKTVYILMAFGAIVLLLIGMFFSSQAHRVSFLFKPSEHNVYAQAPVLTPNAVDIGFAQSMMKHHDEALALATLAMHSNNPTIEKLTHAMVVAQSHERGLMQGWLTAWGKPTLPSGPAMEWVNVPTDQISVQDLNYISRCKASEGGAMPGSPSMNDYELLQGSQGAHKDRLFLELMIKHHEAAVEMADFAGRHAQSDLIKSLSNRIKRDQMKEVLLMKSML